MIVPIVGNQPDSDVADKVDMAVGAMLLLSRLAANDQFFQFVVGAADEVVGPNVEGVEVRVLHLGALVQEE